MRVLAILFLTTSLLACSSPPRIVTKTELVEVEVCEGEFVPVSDNLTITEPRQDIPKGITWKNLIELLMIDRASLEAANGKLEAIRELHGGER